MKEEKEPMYMCTSWDRPESSCIKFTVEVYRNITREDMMNMAEQMYLKCKESQDNLNKLKKELLRE